MLESYYGPKRAYDDVRNYSIPSQTTPKGAELCRAGINLPPPSAFSTPHSLLWRLNICPRQVLNPELATMLVIQDFRGKVNEEQARAARLVNIK